MGYEVALLSVNQPASQPPTQPSAYLEKWNISATNRQILCLGNKPKFIKALNEDDH
jgi:hypothetical protein